MARNGRSAEECYWNGPISDGECIDDKLSDIKLKMDQNLYKTEYQTEAKITNRYSHNRHSMLIFISAILDVYNVCMKCGIW